MYHSVGEPIIHRYNLSLDAFEQQMRFLSTHYRIIHLKDVPSQLKNKYQMDQKIPVAITFDDGYRNLYQRIHPIMERMNFPYTIFIPTAFIGSFASWDADRLPMLTSQDIRKLARSKLVDFGSHSINHRSLTRLSISELKKELKQSKIQLEQLISRRVDMFAYPYGTFGHYSQKIAKNVAESGYRLAVTACFNSMNRADNNFHLRRIFFDEKDNPSIMKAKITGAFDWYIYAEFYDFLLAKLALRLQI
jgi:peptidoglycan/xylan/chitin deacetylase (PgdA/CDA1 family)